MGTACVRKQTEERHQFLGIQSLQEREMATHHRVTCGRGSPRRQLSGLSQGLNSGGTEDRMVTRDSVPRI